MRKRLALTNIDRLLFVWLYRWFPSTADALAIVKPETVTRRHRAGFRVHWRWRLAVVLADQKMSADLRVPIRELARRPAVGSGLDISISGEFGSRDRSSAAST